MKATKMIQTLTTATASLFLFANVAAAHSAHDHSKLSLQWKFSKKIENKIQARGALQGTGYYIGLSAHDQKTMKRYGIRVGNIFTTQVNGVDAYVRRASTGIQIVDSRVMNINVLEQLPIRTLNWVSRISTGNEGHTGHNHSMTPYRICGAHQVRAGFTEELRHQGGQSIPHRDQRANHRGRAHQRRFESYGSVEQ